MLKKCLNKVASYLLIFIMMTSMPAVAFAQSSPYHNTVRHELSQLRSANESLDVAFDLFRIQVALSIDMDLNTFLFDDIGVWLDAYLYQWRKDNNISIPTYEGPMAVTFDVDTNTYHSYSMESMERVFSFVFCQEETLLMQKVTILRVPYVFNRHVDFDEYSLIALMDETLGIQSVEELLDISPLYYIESLMIDAGLSVADFSYNWIDNHEPLHENFSTEGLRYEPMAPVAAPSPSETQYVVGLMEQYGLSAEEAVQMVRGQRGFDGMPHEELGMPFQTQSQTSGITPAPIRRITNTLFGHYHAISHVSTARGSGTGFLISPNVIVTAGHIMYNHSAGTGFAPSLTARPARNGNLLPHGYRHIPRHRAIVADRWIRYRDFGFDWAILTIDSPFFSVPYRMWLAAPSDGDIMTHRTNTTVTGYPGMSLGHNNYMYTNTGRILSLTHTRINTSNRGISGYSGSPMYCPWGWVIGMHVASGLIAYENQIITRVIGMRFTQDIVDFANSLR